MEVPKCWKIVQFSKILTKMKNCRTCYETQTVSRLLEIIPPSPNPPSSDKMLLRLWKKKILVEIYRNMQTFVFKVPQKCSSWASRNGAVQIFSLTLSRNISAGKYLKSERFLAVLREHVFSMSSELRFAKSVRSLAENCIVIFFAKFRWLCSFLPENLKLIRNSEDVRCKI